MKILEEYYKKFERMNPQNTKFKGYFFIFILFMIFVSNIQRISISWSVIISIVVFTFSMVCHEVAHGYIAYRFGDSTAKNEGRLSFNPLKHLDMQGAMLVLLLLLVNSKFLVGWAKPVPVDFDRLRPKKLGFFSVAIAGIVVNLFFALLSGIALKYFVKDIGLLLLIYGNSTNIIAEILLYTYIINLALALFNLIPITPLDGGRIVYILGNEKVKKFYNKIEKYGIFIVFSIVYLGVYLNLNIVDKILTFFLKVIIM